jgi:hypothetical protein
MGELGFWDDLDNFDYVVAATGTGSLFDDTNLFAAEALDAASPACSSPVPASPAAAARAQLQVEQRRNGTQLSLVATGAGEPNSALLVGPTARTEQQWRGGSFLDSNCPLRRRVKVTITNEKSKDKRKKRTLEQTLAASPSPAVVTAPVQGGPLQQPTKRPRTSVKMQTTLCFAPAGEAHQPRFHLDIRKCAPGSSTTTATATSGSRAAKKGSEKVVGNTSRPALFSTASKSSTPARVVPAPRAKTLSGAAAAAAAARAARAAKHPNALPKAGVSVPTSNMKGGSATSATRSLKASKLVMATATAAANTRLARTAIVARRTSCVSTTPGPIEKATTAGSPLSIDAVSFVTADMSSRLAEVSSQGSGCAPKPSSAPQLVPALEAVNSAAAAYRAILGEDSCDRPMDLTADFDFVSRLLG